MEPFYNLLHSLGMSPVLIQIISWCTCALLLFLGIFGMGISQGRFNYINL